MLSVHAHYTHSLSLSLSLSLTPCFLSPGLASFVTNFMGAALVTYLLGYVVEEKTLCANEHCSHVRCSSYL